MTYMPSNYRKKPLVVQAMRWLGPGPGNHGTGPAVEDLQAWGVEVAPTGNWGRESDPEEWALLVSTLEGPLLARPGDWIVRGVRGEFYPVKPDIFEATYEPA